MDNIRKTFMLWIDTNDQPSAILPMRLANTAPYFIRLTGGANLMAKSDGERGIRLLTQALNGFGGVLMSGGARVFEPTGSGYKPYPTVLEVPPILRKINRNMITLAICPKMTQMEYSDLGIIVDRNNETGFIAVMQPNQDLWLIQQKNVDQVAQRSTEWRECLELTQVFFATRDHFGATLISYNGGDQTSEEISAWASANLNVILFAGSGRVTDEYCQNRQWLDAHPSVYVCHDEWEVRQKLISLGGLLG